MKVRHLKKLQLKKQRWLLGKPAWQRHLPPIRRDRRGNRIPHIYVIECACDYGKEVFDSLSGRREYEEDGNLHLLMTGEIGSLIGVSITSSPCLGTRSMRKSTPGSTSYLEI